MGSGAKTMSDDDSEDDWELLWNARKGAIETVLGPASDRVYHATIPLDLGGSADVLEFPNYGDGVACVTADLVGESGQRENSLGQYELMICTRRSTEWAPSLISRLAPYTLEVPLEPFETMDIAPAVPQPSSIVAFLFTEPSVASNSLSALGKRFGLLLCVGITAVELAECHAGRTATLLQALKDEGVFPFTDLERTDVVRGQSG
jgi:hypothetical protein